MKPVKVKQIGPLWGYKCRWNGKVLIAMAADIGVLRQLHRELLPGRRFFPSKLGRAILRASK